MEKGFKITPDNIPNDGIMFVDNEEEHSMFLTCTNLIVGLIRQVIILLFY